MKRASAIVVSTAMTGALHCEAPVPGDRAYEAELPDRATSECFRGQGRPPSSAAAEVRSGGVDLGAVVLELEGDSRSGDDSNASSKITSSVTAPDGSRYVAGEFSGVLSFGGTVLTSHGGADIFIARILPDGTVAWVHDVGSSRTESSPRISFEDGRVTLVAMTNGAVDCGKGPLSTWSTETFFLCTFGSDGAPRSGGSFPTGRP